MARLPAELTELLGAARAGTGRVVVLTGAGISAESGIPTFRGPEGYWKIGSRNYFPEEMATQQAFRTMPEEVWSWYLYRRAVCGSAEPNTGHLALAELEQALGDDFLLITQNVDGLHLRAGNSLERTYQIHGNLNFVRCSAECRHQPQPFPTGLLDGGWDIGRRVSVTEADQLRCQSCAAWLRPHVLWFDECYDEERYRFESSLHAADDASLLLVIGTSGATNLPVQVCETVHRRGAAMVVVNQDESPFSRMAQLSPTGFFARGASGAWIPGIVGELRRAEEPI